LYNLKQRTYPFNQRVPGIRKNKKKEEAAAHTHTPDERGTLTHKQHTWGTYAKKAETTTDVPHWQCQTLCISVSWLMCDMCVWILTLRKMP